MVVTDTGRLLPRPLRGVIVPMVTPLSGRQALDVAGLERLIEHMLSGGVHGLFVLGTTGEAAALDDDVRRELVRRTCTLVAGRVPVLVGVTDTRVSESVRLARWAADAGADAVVISTPFYLPLEQQELIEYVKTICSQQPLPCFLYNIPALTKTAYEPATVVRLAELTGVVGVKDSSGDLAYLQRLREAIGRPDFSFFVGTELLMADAIRGGAHGCVGGGANLDPRLLVSLYEAAVRGDGQGAASLQARLMMLDRIYRLTPGTTSILRGLKCALGSLGICDDRMGEPLRAATPAERRMIERYVAELGLMPAKLAAGATVSRGDVALPGHSPETSPAAAAEGDGDGARLVTQTESR